MKKIIVIAHDNRTITIDMIRREISTSAPGKIYPVKKLSVNKSHVLKVNKTAVSTSNVEMLQHVLNTSLETFNIIHSYIYGVIDHDTAQTVNTTISSFYASFNSDVNAFADFFRTASPETRQTIIYDHICFNHAAKMADIISLSTYVGNNRFCLARRKSCDAICSHCYANSLTAQRSGLKNKLRRIHAILTQVELSAGDIPIIDSNIYKYFRFESFGDINNVIQVKNYNAIAAVNKNVNFTLWTKNPGIVQSAINNGLQLSDNLVIGLSSLYLNRPDIHIAQKYSFIRFLFTVYTPEHIKENNIVINCGAKHCITCGLCYKYLHEYKNGLQLINEKLK